MNTLNLFLYSLILSFYLTATFAQQKALLGGDYQVPQNQLSNYIKTDKGFSLARPQGERIFQLIYEVPLGETTAVSFQLTTGTVYKFNATSSLGEVEITVLTQAWLNVIKVVNIRFLDAKNSTHLHEKFVKQVAQHYKNPTVQEQFSPQIVSTSPQISNQLANEQVKKTLEALGIFNVTPPYSNQTQKIAFRNALRPTNESTAQVNTIKNDTGNQTEKLDIKIPIFVNKTERDENKSLSNESKLVKKIGNITNISITIIEKGAENNNISVADNKINQDLASGNSSHINNKTIHTNATNTSDQANHTNITSTPNNASASLPIPPPFLFGRKPSILAQKLQANLIADLPNSPIGNVLGALGNTILNSLNLIKDAIQASPDKPNIRSVATNETNHS